MAEGPQYEPADTSDESYARRLQTTQWWKRLISAQAPYRWNLRRQALGRTLDVGCGVGRNLVALRPDSVGIDHNPLSVQVARVRGCTALTVAEWESSELRQPEVFDGLLMAHVLEHMDRDVAHEMVREYLPWLRPGGRAFFICPQERGYASDPTHIQWTSGDDLARLARDVGLKPEKSYSFPFPRWAGKWFTYNEFCLLATKP